MRHGLFIVAASIVLGAPAQALTVSIAPVALRGQVAPGTVGATFNRFGDPAMNGEGTVAFAADLSGGDAAGRRSRAIFTSAGLAARGGDVAPGLGGVALNGPDDPVVDGSGAVVFGTGLVGTGVNGTNNTAIVAGGSIVARKGAPAPGTAGAVFSAFIGQPAVSDGGVVAFQARLSGGDAVGPANEGLFAGSDLVARRGGAAPGTAGALYDSFGAPAINAAGQLAHVAGLRGGDTTNTTNIAVFAAWSLVAREGDAAPGTAGARFADFDDPALNAAGQAAFAATLLGGDTTPARNRAVFSRGALVAREGDTAPGTAGARFLDFASPALNDRGETAFFAYLAGGDVSGPNNLGLYAADASGTLHLIARPGGTLVVDGVARLIGGLSFRREGFSDHGLAFRAALAGGIEGLFVAGFARDATATPVPLPAPLGFMLAGLAAFGLMRRRLD